MELEEFKRMLIGVGIDMPDEIMYGQQINGNMLSMIGYLRMTNIETLIKQVLHNNIEGDLIETGVWRGGACMFMRKVLNHYGSPKKVIVADSFEGLPMPDEKYPFDKGDTHYKYSMLAVGLDEVKGNFEKHGLLENTEFVKGWFKDTLPTLRNDFSIIRLDGDMYESTMDALTNLYPNLSDGGYCIIDDYGAVKGCYEAVQQYRSDNGITSEIIPIDGTGIYWQK